MGAATYARFVLAFLVTIPLSLAPLLGQLQVPGFTALLNVFPVNLREGLIAFGGLCMTLPAIAVQAYYTATPRRVALRRWMLPLLALTLVLLVTLYAVYTFVVIQVPYFGGDRYERYVVGSRQLPTCECARRQKEITECIGPILSFNPATIEACFPAIDVQRRKLFLGLSYLALLSALGASIGVLTLSDRPRAGTRKQ